MAASALSCTISWFTKLCGTQLMRASLDLAVETKPWEYGTFVLEKMLREFMHTTMKSYLATSINTRILLHQHLLMERSSYGISGQLLSHLLWRLLGISWQSGKSNSHLIMPIFWLVPHSKNQNTLLIFSYSDMSVHIWDCNVQRVINKFDQHTEFVVGLDFNLFIEK